MFLNTTIPVPGLNLWALTGRLVVFAPVLGLGDFPPVLFLPVCFVLAMQCVVAKEIPKSSGRKFEDKMNSGKSAMNGMLKNYVLLRGRVWDASLFLTIFRAKIHYNTLYFGNN